MMVNIPALFWSLKIGTADCFSYFASSSAYNFRNSITGKASGNTYLFGVSYDPILILN